MKKFKILTYLVALAVAPFIASVTLAATPIRIDAIRNGVDFAIANQIIPEDGALQSGVKQFLKLIIDGATPEDASNRTGIKLTVISRLQQLGTGHTPALVRVKPKPFTPIVEIASSPATPSQTTEAPVQKSPQSIVVVPAIKTASAIAPPGESPAKEPVAMAASPEPVFQVSGQPVAKAPTQKIAPISTAVAPTPVKPELKLAAVNPYQIANALVRGLTVANRTGEIGYSAPLSAKVQSLVRELRRGVALEMAAKSSDVPQKTLKRLLQIGNL